MFFYGASGVFLRASGVSDRDGSTGRPGPSTGRSSIRYRARLVDGWIPATAKVAATILVAAVLAACGRGSDPVEPRAVVMAAGAGDRATLEGAGSTAVSIVLREWVDRYRRVAPGVSMRYQLLGSEAGIRRVLAGDADFAFSDVTLMPGEDPGTGRNAVIQVPCAGQGVAIVYNLPEVDGLRLAPETLAGLLRGTITRWDDPAIATDNQAAGELPDTAVTVVHRVERSGTTGVLTRWLQQAAPREWGLGFARQVAWPKGVEARGSEGMVSAVRRTRGGIGYVSLAHAREAGLKVAAVSNSSGKFVNPTSATVAATLSRARGNDRDLTLEVPPAEAPAAYPIAGFVYLVFRPQSSAAGSEALRHFAEWLLTDGQTSTERLGYSALPVPLSVRTLSGLRAGGVPVRE